MKISKDKIMVIFISSVIAISVTGCNNSQDKNGIVSINSTYTSAQPFKDLTAWDLTAELKIGWNLGNTLDTAGNNAKGYSWLGGGLYANTSVSQMETAWGNPVTTKANIDAIKNAGFNTIRIPVTWHKACDEDFNIRPDWMARVIEVVNYAIESDMYVILNTHHDEEIFKFTNLQLEDSLITFKKVWQQIAANFKYYNEKLIFEGLNEPRTKNTPNEWTGGTLDERINLAKHYQVFVDTVRASGGNNGRRILMINTYAAASSIAAIVGFIVPKDTVENKLIVSVHMYSPYNFALNTNKNFNTWDSLDSSDTSAITDPINRVYDAFVSKGIPVVIGEFGAMCKDNEETRAEWAEFFVSYAMSKGIPCIWWDNGGFTGDGELFGLLNRRNNSFPYQKIIEALMRGSG
jgi:endoglucanase